MQTCNVQRSDVVMAKESVPIALLSHVLCSVSLPLFENLSAGFVQSSKKVQDVWYYCVAFPPSNVRSSWSLVADVHPSQISLVKDGVPVEDAAVKSIARVSKSNFRPSKVILNIYSTYSKTNSFCSEATAKRNLRRSSMRLCTTQASNIDLINAAEVSAQEFSLATYANTHPLTRQAQPFVQESIRVESTIKGRVCDSKEATKPHVQRPHVQRRHGNIGRVHPKCQHGKRQTICWECKGGSLCEHGKQRYWCVLCGGGAFCVHGKQKSKCLQCHGSGICKHMRVRTKCPDCKSNKRTN